MGFYWHKTWSSFNTACPRGSKTTNCSETCRQNVCPELVDTCQMSNFTDRVTGIKYCCECVQDYPFNGRVCTPKCSCQQNDCRTTTTSTTGKTSAHRGSCILCYIIVVVINVCMNFFSLFYFSWETNYCINKW